MIEATNRRRESAEFEWHALVEKKPEMFERVVAKQIEGIETELGELTREAEKLGKEIEALTGKTAPGAG